MPAKRKTLDRRARPQVSAEAVRLWRLCRGIEDERATERWEDDRRPGRRREYLDAGKALQRELGIPWVDHNPLHVESETPPTYIAENSVQAPQWRRAWELRCALIEAAGE
jgi:hypothetical protein